VESQSVTSFKPLKLESGIEQGVVKHGSSAGEIAEQQGARRRPQIQSAQSQAQQPLKAARSSFAHAHVSTSSVSSLYSAIAAAVPVDSDADSEVQPRGLSVFA
jgi:hypothetical protein